MLISVILFASQHPVKHTAKKLKEKKKKEVIGLGLLNKIYWYVPKTIFTHSVGESKVCLQVWASHRRINRDDGTEETSCAAKYNTITHLKYTLVFPMCLYRHYAFSKTEHSNNRFDLGCSSLLSQKHEGCNISSLCGSTMFRIWCTSWMFLSTNLVIKWQLLTCYNVMECSDPANWITDYCFVHCRNEPFMIFIASVNFVDCSG